MSSPKKMGYIGKSVIGEEDLQGEEYHQTYPYRANAQRGFELIAPHLFPDSDEQGSALYPRASNQFDADSLVNTVVSNVHAQNMAPVAEAGMSRSQIPSQAKNAPSNHYKTCCPESRRIRRLKHGCQVRARLRVIFSAEKWSSWP